MTLALRLRKWGGGGGNSFSPPFILRAGGRLELECQSPDRGRKRTWSSDRGKGAPRAPLTSPTPPPRPFRSPSQEPRCWAKQPVLGFSRGKVGGGDRWGRVKSREASLPRQSGALFSMPHTSDPFPTLAWLGGGVGRDEWGGGGGLETTSRLQ